jgi:hypothetical protein
MILRSIPLMIVLLAGTSTYARDSDTIEELAEVRDFETAQIDKQTVKTLGEETRVDVRVTWRDPGQRPPGAPGSRVLRYIVKCKDQAIALAAVTTIDQNGKMIKRFVTPPGSWGFVRRTKGRTRNAGSGSVSLNRGLIANEIGRIDPV